MLDRRTGAPTWLATSRQARPNLPGDCPFCPGGREAPEPYDVRWFPNRWPAMPDGRCEVILFSPDHGRSLASLGRAGVRRVIDLWAARTSALGGRGDVAAVLPFENRGDEVGATIDHPHGQLYAFDEVPPVLRAELEGEGCWVCEEAAGARLVVDGTCRAWTVEASRYPFELVVAPAAHRPDLPSLDGDDRDALASALVDVLGALDAVHDEPMPYMLWVHQRPTDGGPWPSSHVHVEVVGVHRAAGVLRHVAAGELGSGVWFNPVDPTAAAALLRRGVAG